MTQNQKNLLLIDDDEELRTTLKLILERAGYRVTLAQGGRIAQHLVESQRFDAVLTDLRMPDGNGVELIYSMRARKDTTPVVVMSAFATQDDAKQALVFGADEILPKPFSKEDLLEVIDLCFEQDTTLLGEAAGETEYCKLGLDDFVTGAKLMADIFIRLSEAKYVRIAAANDTMRADQLAAYRNKGVRHLYMRKADFRAYIGMNVTLTKAIAHDARITRIRKLRLVKHVGETLLEQVIRDGIDTEVFDQAKTVLETAVTLLTDDLDAWEMLKILKSHSNHLYAHSLAVSAYSVMLARQMRWKSPSTLYKLAIGGMFHDIGKKELDSNLLSKPRRNMTAAEIKVYESHPVRGLQILETVRSIPGDVLEIVAQHHENCLGSGYPAGLRKNRTHPLARVVAVANAFCELAMDGPHNPAIPPEIAVRRLLQASDNVFEAPLLVGLAQLFNGDVSRRLVSEYEKKVA